MTKKSPAEEGLSSLRGVAEDASKRQPTSNDSLVSSGRLVPPTLLEHSRPVAERDLLLRPALHRRTIGRQRDEVVTNGGNLLDEVLAGRVVPTVDGVRMVGPAG